MSDAELDLDECRQKLTQERERLLAASEGDRESRKPVELDQASVGRLSRMDAMQMQAMAKGAEQRRQSRIRQIDAALMRIDTDDFGFCAVCGEDIDRKRLEMDPAIAVCVDCSRRGR